MIDVYNNIVPMKINQHTEQLRKLLIEKILHCIDGNKSKEYIIELARLFHHKPEIQNDIPLLQSVTVLDFLSKQLSNGNRDVISHEIVQESYVYILDKLM